MTSLIKKILLLGFFLGLYTPVNAEQYKRHKYTCPESQGECSEGERAAIKLVNETYWGSLQKELRRINFTNILGIGFIKKMSSMSVNIQLRQKRICELILQIWNGLMLIFVKRPLS